MRIKEKLLSTWLVALVTSSFLVSHFWASTIHLFGRAVALNLVALKGLTKMAAAICGVNFLP